MYRKGQPIRGRGAVSNDAGRFEPQQYEVFDDGWGSSDEAIAHLETVVRHENTRTIIAQNDSPDIPFSRSINPYRGCEHGCVYCFARPSHAYLNLSAGLDFETQLVAKPMAPQALVRAFGATGYVPEVIALGANTDPYQPVERRLQITRKLLEVFREHHHPVVIVTKSSSILRDLDLLAPMAKQGLAAVMVSVTTLDAALARRLEPRAAPPRRRLDTIGRLAAAGVAVGVLASPMIPALNDAELESILEACAGQGATRAGTILLRLPGELKDIFAQWLQTHYPERAARVLSLLRQCHGGELYNSSYATRMRGTGPYAKLLFQRFDVACRRLGLQQQSAPLRTDLFRRPPKKGQMSLF